MISVHEKQGKSSSSSYPCSLSSHRRTRRGYRGTDSDPLQQATPLGPAAHSPLTYLHLRLVLGKENKMAAKKKKIMKMMKMMKIMKMKMMKIMNKNKMKNKK